MKKLIALTLSLLMVFTVIPMAIVSAADESVSKVILDFEDQNGIGVHIGDAGSKLIDTSTITNSVFDAWKTNSGSYCASVNGKGNWASFNLPENWWIYTDENDGTTYTKPSLISFDITSSTTSKSASLNGVAFTIGAAKEGLDKTKFTTLKAVGEVTASAKTYRTVKYKIPTTLDLSQFTRVVVNCWGTNDNCYIDNVTLVYPKSYTATFSGTETAELASPVDSIAQNFTNGETSIVLPDATLANGKTFAGWVTEADSATVLPAGTEVSLEDDTAFYAVATDRGPYPTPDAPTVASKTFNSVTLTALGSDFVYSKDGTTWQESNEFTSLEPSTEYTFYTKHIATLAYDESAVSEGTTVTTEAITEFIFSSDYVTLSDNTANLGFNSNDGYPNISKTGLTAGKGVTVTTKYTVDPGVYDLTLYARSYAGRAPVDVEINGTKVAESLDTSSSSGTTGNNKAFALGSITIPETTVLTIKFKTTGSGSLYLNSLKLDKTADYVNTLTTDAISTKDTASIRLSDTINGIRFYTTVDEEKLNTLVDGQTYEMGTLIGPKDKINGELTAEDLADSNAVAVKYQYGSFYTEGEGDNAFSGIVGSLVGIKEDNTSFDTTYGNINRDFVARGYVKVGDTYYYSSTTATRSLGYIANEYVKAGNIDNANANKWAAAYSAVNPSAE